MKIVQTLKGERMSEKRFIRDGKYVFDTERETVLDIDLICILLNRFAEENEQLRQTIIEMRQDEQLYAREIVKLNKEVKDNQFLRLGNDY